MANVPVPMKRQKTDAGTVAVAVAAAVVDAPAINVPEADIEDVVAAPPPTNKVFTVVELLEQILSNLNVTELTRVEGVNSLWKRLIRTAPAFQEQRFLKATPVIELLTYVCVNVTNSNTQDDTEDDDELEWSPRLTKDTSALYWQDSDEEKKASIIANLHPCMFTIGVVCPESRSRLLLPFDPSQPVTALQSLGGRSYITICPSTMLGWASGPWENMLLSQPPCDLQNSEFIGARGEFLDSIDSSVTTLGSLRDCLGHLRRGKGKEDGWLATLVIEGVWPETDREVQKARKFKANNPTTVNIPPALEAETGADV